MARYIDLDKAIEKIRAEGIRGVGWSDSERERDVIVMLERCHQVEIVRCKDCKWWQCKKILLDDGIYRDYLPGEYESGSILGGVSGDVGINIGSHCTRRNFDGDKWWCKEDDFCSFTEREEQ